MENKITFHDGTVIYKENESTYWVGNNEVRQRIKVDHKEALNRIFNKLSTTQFTISPNEFEKLKKTIRR